MKEIKAIIQPFMLDKVLDALHTVHELPGCTVSQVEGYGRYSGKESGENAREYEESYKLKQFLPLYSILLYIVYTIKS